MHRRLISGGKGFQCRHTRQHGIGAEGLRQAGKKRAQDRGGIEFTQIRQQGPPGFVTLAGNARAAIHMEQRIAQLPFQEGPAIFDHQDFIKPLRKATRGIGIQGPGQAHLPNTQALGAGKIFRNAGLSQCLAQNSKSLAAHGDAETRIGAIQHHAVNAIGPRKRIGARQLHMAQAFFLQHGRVSGADMHAIGRCCHALRFARGVKCGVQHHRHGRIHGVGHTLHANPGACVTAQRNALQTIFQHFRHIGGVQHGDFQIHEGVFAAGCDRGGFGGRIIPRQRQHTALRRAAGGIGMAEHIAGAINAGTFAVPNAENAIQTRAGCQMHLLRTPNGGCGQILIQPRLKHHIMRAEPFRLARQFPVKSAKRRSAIAGNETAGAETLRCIHFLAQHGQAHQRMRPGQQDGAGAGFPTFFERGLWPDDASHAAYCGDCHRECQSLCEGLVLGLGLIEMRLDGVEDAQHPKADQPKAENAHADILRLGGGEQAEQCEQAIKGEEENAGTGHGGGSFPG